MTTPEIAHRLVELCRQPDYETAQTELFSAHAISVEPEGSQAPHVTGRDAIMAKGKKFREMFEIHESKVSEPVIGGSFFSVAMALDVTPRAGGKRFSMEEICVYEVRDGKILREQFFHPVQS